MNIQYQTNKLINSGQTTNQQTDEIINHLGKKPEDTTPKNLVSDMEVYSYLINEKKLDRNKSLGILANIHGESNWGESDFWIDAEEQGDTQEGIGLFQFTFWSRKAGLLKNVPDYKTNWKGQVDYFLQEPEAKGYLEQNFETANKAAEYLMNENIRPDPEHRPGRTEKHNKYLENFIKNLK